MDYFRANCGCTRASMLPQKKAAQRMLALGGFFAGLPARLDMGQAEKRYAKPVIRNLLLLRPAVQSRRD